jgi:hypothetical protein
MPRPPPLPLLVNLLSNIAHCMSLPLRYLSTAHFIVDTKWMSGVIFIICTIRGSTKLDLEHWNFVTSLRYPSCIFPPVWPCVNNFYFPLNKMIFCSKLKRHTDNFRLWKYFYVHHVQVDHEGLQHYSNKNQWLQKFSLPKEPWVESQCCLEEGCVSVFVCKAGGGGGGGRTVLPACIIYS